MYTKIEKDTFSSYYCENQNEKKNSCHDEFNSFFIVKRKFMLPGYYIVMISLGINAGNGKKSFLELSAVDLCKVRPLKFHWNINNISAG